MNSPGYMNKKDDYLRSDQGADILRPMIFDSHAHYDSTQFDEDRGQLLAGMKDSGVGTIINVGASLEGCESSVKLAGEYDFIYAAVGVHPDDIGDLNEETFARLRELAGSKKVVAIGEIGLDYHWDTHPRQLQKYWFIRQLSLARDMGLPVIIHSRDAAKDTFDIMAQNASGLKGVIHCYSYSPQMAMDYVKLGFHIGLGGVVTFKNAKKSKETAAVIPMENLLLETDCPYMAPVPFRGKRNNSAYIDYVAAEIAQIRGITKEEVIRGTAKNAERLFNI